MSDHLHSSWCSFELQNGCVMQMRTCLFGKSEEEVRFAAERGLSPWASPGETAASREISLVVHENARKLYHAAPEGYA